MDAEVATLTGAGRGERTPRRVTNLNGYPPRISPGQRTALLEAGAFVLAADAPRVRGEPSAVHRCLDRES